MRFILVLTLLCLSVPAFAQEESVTMSIKNIRFTYIGFKDVQRTTYLDANTLEIITGDNNIHLQVIPNKIKLFDNELPEQKILFGAVSVQSDKPFEQSFEFNVYFELTDSITDLPCLSRFSDTKSETKFLTATPFEAVVNNLKFNQINLSFAQPSLGQASLWHVYNLFQMEGKISATEKSLRTARSLRARGERRGNQIR